jgi:hypothetical protein
LAGPPPGPVRPAPVASLPMYDWPELRWATDALWSVIAEEFLAEGLPAPPALDRARPPEEVWRDPGLVFSQSCGYPFATRFADTLRIVATPVYDVDGCEGPLYSSMIVARRSDGGSARAGGLADYAGRRFAFNASDSLSGFVAFRVALAEAGVGEGDWIETGSHRQSILAVASGLADLAAIDAVCWSLAEEFEPDAVGRLAVIARTPLRPSLPFVTSALMDESPRRTRPPPAPSPGRTLTSAVGHFRALKRVVRRPEAAPACAALRLKDVARLDPSDYRALASLGPSAP